MSVRGPYGSRLRYNAAMSNKLSSPSFTPNQLRQKYLDFFVQQLHKVISSASLVPENDPTTLFTSSGMQPLVPYLLGQAHAQGTRLVNSQKAFRSQDIEEVGDNRHTTFFEMLGNWSLGDYFKKEQLKWFFTFLTQEVGLDPQKLYVTVFRGNEQLQVPRDSESVAIWQEIFATIKIKAKAVDFSDRDGLQGGRIFYFDEKKNWWSRSGVPANMPAGEPGGPDSEVFFDFGEQLKLHENSSFSSLPCHVNCDCGRFMEIGNSVFMQYQKQADGSFQELPQKNVDFGGGLERIMAASINQIDVFRTPFFEPLIQMIEAQSGQKYNAATQLSMRVIADHLKAATFLIMDGVLPSNKAQGYVLRRLLRRAAVKANLLGMKYIESLPSLSAAVLSIYDGVHGVSKQEQQEFVAKIIFLELKKFEGTLKDGLKILEKEKNVSGKIAFDIYQSYGFPLELTLEIVTQKGQKIDVAEFTHEFENHKQLSRSSSAGMFKGGLADHSDVTTQFHTATHLLQAALRQLIGEGVAQKGSHITSERLRFDFTCPQALTATQKEQVLHKINTWISEDLPVARSLQPKKTALSSGAIGLFLDKYGDEVTVYTVGRDEQTDWVSKELCGGPHVEHTGLIGPLKLIKEEAVSAGVRRIYLSKA